MSSRYFSILTCDRNYAGSLATVCFLFFLQTHTQKCSIQLLMSLISIKLIIPTVTAIVNVTVSLVVVVDVVGMVRW